MGRPKGEQVSPKVGKTRWDDALGMRLREHFETEESDGGLRSLHGSFVDMALSGPPTTGGIRREPDARITDRVLIRTAEHREVRSALERLGVSPKAAKHRSVLWLAYGPHQFHGQVYARFPSLGRACPVVLLSTRAGEAFRREIKKRTEAGRERVEIFEREGVGEWLRAGAPAEVVEQAIADGESSLREARRAIEVILDASRARRSPAQRAERVRVSRRLEEWLQAPAERVARKFRPEPLIAGPLLELE